MSEKYLIEREGPDGTQWYAAPLSEAEAYDLLQEELTGITAEDLEDEPTQEERDLDQWLRSDPESFYGYLPRSAR